MKLALRAVERSRLPLIKPVNLRDAIQKRLLFYGEPSEYFCYINVGGSLASLGSGAHMRYTRGGWYFDPLTVRGDPDGVADRFLNAGIPMLNLLHLRELNDAEKIVADSTGSLETQNDF